MAKFKIRYVKFLFSPKQHRGEDWKKAPEAKMAFGNRHTDEYNTYMFNGNHISIIFSDYLRNDPRRWDKKAKFTESEASILLLKYLEDNLKDCRKTKKDLEKTLENSVNFGVEPYAQARMWEYSIAVNKRELEFNQNACKIWRKKVREIKKSPQYLWEQLLK